MGKKYIAIDLGAESGRVIAGELTSDGIALVQLHRFANIPVQQTYDSAAPARLRWNITELWREIRAGLDIAAARFGAANIASVGVDAWGLDFALLDHRHALVAAPVCYRDPRTAGMPDLVFARLPRERIYQITGMQTMEINTLFQLASMSLAGDLPNEWHATRYILFLPDLFSYWLCGNLGTEYTIASTSQMLDARSRRWSPEILRAVDVDPAFFSPLQMPGEKNSIRGTLLPSVHAGLAAAGVKVVAVASHDTASAVAAVPAPAHGADWLFLSSGTWSLLGAEVDEPVLTDTASRYDLTNEGGVGGTIRLLKNIAGLWLLQECRREWTRQGLPFDYAALTALAESAPSPGFLLDLADPRFAAPGNMPDKIAAHCRARQLPAPASPAQFVRLILESLAAMYAKIAAMLSQATGRTYQTLHIVGGGSQNHLLNQLAADATGLTVLAGPVEATALGNVIAQAMALGDVTSIAEGRARVANSAAIQRFLPKTVPSR